MSVKKKVAKKRVTWPKRSSVFVAIGSNHDAMFSTIEDAHKSLKDEDHGDNMITDDICSDQLRTIGLYNATNGVYEVAFTTTPKVIKPCPSCKGCGIVK